MEWIIAHEFSFLMLLAGIPITTAGVLYKIHSPKEAVWYYGIGLKRIFRDKAGFQKAHRDMAIPMVIVGSLFILAALLPILFPHMPFFTFKAAILLILMGSLVFRLLVEKRLRF